MPAELTPLALAARLALALALALFVGLAFEEVYKREQRSAPGGVRTFPMFTLSGAMLYLIEPKQAFAFIAGLIALAIWHYAHLRAAPPEAGAPTLMIPVSNLVAYLIGPVALTQPPWVAVAASVTAVLLVGTREKLHRLIQLVPQDELLTAGKFLILVGIILPLVPHEPVTTISPLTPFRVWLAVVAVSTVSYMSYLLQTYVPVREATLVPAILGGAYSSTATTIVLAKRQAEAGAERRDLAAGIVAATTVMYLRLGAIVAIFDLGLAWALAPALAVLFALGGVLAAYEWRAGAREKQGSEAKLPALNPLQIPAALTFAVVFIVISLLSQWTRTAFGQPGILVLSALVGISDVDPFVINIAQGGVSGLSVAVLSAAILIAASANNIAKAGYVIGFAGLQCSRRPASMLVGLALAGLIAAALALEWQS
jgi:uncharacterized membrane protein (DUF4010 family)